MRVFFVGAPVEPHPVPGVSDEVRFAATGYNTGNLLIGQSLLEELCVNTYGYDLSMPVEEIHERYEVIVIAAANFIFRGFDLSPLAAFIESTRLRCVMVGLGVQAPAAGARFTDIPAGTRRLLHIVADRGHTVGVRGDFTADVMNRFGIRNVRVVGCPSLYRARTPALTIRRPDPTKPMRVSLNGSRNIVEHSMAPMTATRVEAALIRLSMENGYEYVLQNEDPEMRILWSESEAPGHAAHLATIIRRLDLQTTPQRLFEHIRARNRVFLNLEDWDRYMALVDYSLGSRVHGNLIALTNGVAATILALDVRTTEMAELMAIPHVSIVDVREVNVAELAARSDYDAFERRYKVLYERYATFLDDNDLAHRLRATGAACAPACSTQAC
jgi:hypothetical protein